MAGELAVCCPSQTSVSLFVTSNLIVLVWFSENVRNCTGKADRREEGMEEGPSICECDHDKLSLVLAARVQVQIGSC